MNTRNKRSNVLGQLAIAGVIIAIVLYMTLWKGMRLSDIGSQLIERAPGESRGAMDRLTD